VFRIRELERQGRLTATRGAMASAWYSRQQILMVRHEEGAAPPPEAPARPTPGRRRSDAELIAYLRGAGTSAPAVAGRSPTLADLVADMGVSIPRAQRVYRFWLAHDVHPAAQQARTGRPPSPGTMPTTAAQASPSTVASERPTSPAGVANPPATPANVPERRSHARLARATLIRQLRAADPALRAAAFSALKNTRPPADVP